ncbi:pisatin demethylase [Massarina eburnea CBS 473.64]|uniref:Pisatin demethylase n=1 Tax=Massarina eburnea CBS 473.64 TaxID=1395130 RepID=A0A6A6SBM3_9PLEO|nr:pisatin demethylase [Massarina eburnea CBS 473.64]
MLPNEVLRQLLPLFGLGIAYYVLGVVRQYFRLRQFKGPPTSGWSWWWHSRAVLSGASHRWYSEATESYGPIARVAPNLLVTSDADVWARVTSVRSQYTRAPWYYHAARFETGKDNVFTECDNGRHDARRKKMASAYAGKENPGLEASIDRHVKELVQLIGRKYAAPADSTKSNKPMDLATKIQFFTLDVISDIGTGHAFGDLQADSDVHSYIASSELGLRISNQAYGLGTSWLSEIPILGKAISPSEKDASGFGRMMHEVRKTVSSRITRSTSEKSDMVASFIRHGVSGDDLFQEVFEQILAGSDTTAAAIRITLLYVMSHPRVYKKLQAEIDSVVKEGRVEDVVSDVEARRLPYLAAVVREGMRIHPPVVNLFARVVPKDGDVVKLSTGEEVFIPGETMIGYAGWSMHRHNRAVYGDDTDVFRPERWIVDQSKEVEKERLVRMTRVNDLVFGQGRWGCLGKVVALTEMHKVIFELLRHFELGISRPAEPWKVWESLGLWDIKEFWVDVVERE